MPGCSLSVLRADDERLALLDSETEARAWPGGGAVNQSIRIPVAAASHVTLSGQSGTVTRANKRGWAQKLKPALDAVAHALIANEAILTDLDSKAGDGDHELTPYTCQFSSILDLIDAST